MPLSHQAYVAEGDEFPSFHVYVCAAFLVRWSTELRKQDFADAIRFLQNPPTEEWGDEEVGMLLSQAYQWREMYGRSSAHLQVE
jgi:hypothetical protein